MRQYQRAIFFTKVPLGGFYKFEDIFQIFPVDLENMPKSSFQTHHPNILEYWITDEEKILIPEEFEGLEELLETIGVALIKQDKILGLLSTFTNNLFFRYTGLEGNWGMEMLKGKEVNSRVSMWCMKMFYFPELSEQFKIDKFTEQKIEPIKKIPRKVFYAYNPNLDFDSKKDVVFPETIDQLLHSYFSLDAAKMLSVDAAVSYTVSAIELWNSRKTLSLLASFTSMETMVNLEFKDVAAEKCAICGQLKYSVARKFKEYLLKYIGTSENNKKKFNKYYSWRSKIVHTGQQLKTEILFADVPKDEQHIEFVKRVEILQIGKLAITNWLLTNPSGVEQNI